MYNRLRKDPSKPFGSWSLYKKKPKSETATYTTEMNSNQMPNHLFHWLIFKIKLHKYIKALPLKAPKNIAALSSNSGKAPHKYKDPYPLAAIT